MDAGLACYRLDIAVSTGGQLIDEFLARTPFTGVGTDVPSVRTLRKCAPTRLIGVLLMRALWSGPAPELVVLRSGAVLVGGVSLRQRTAGQLFSVSRPALDRLATTSS